MNEVCLFCNEPEKNYNPGSHIDYVCGLCVILLADADQEDLKKSYQKALNEGHLRKASALEAFIQEEIYNVRKAKNSKRNMERTRPLRKVRPSRHQVRA